MLTPLIKKLAWKLRIVDYPDEKRKVHSYPVALLGGLAVFLSFGISLLISWQVGWLNDGIIVNSQILGVLLGGGVLIIGGWLDDKFKLKPWQSFLFPIVAAVLAVSLGIAVKYVTNPFLTGTGPYGRALFYFSWVL